MAVPLFASMKIWRGKPAAPSCGWIPTRATQPRALYKKLGYQEIGIVPTVFNDIPDVQLVLIEKTLIA